MTGMGVVMDEDPLEHALRENRAARQVAARTPTAPSAIGARLRERTATPPLPDAHPDTVAWLALERRRRALDDELKALVSRQDRLRQQILERWSMDGTGREQVDGLTVHTQRRLYPKVADKARLAVALREEGLHDVLTVDEKAFGVYLTACDEAGTPLPESIAAQIADSFERFALVVKLR